MGRKRTTEELVSEKPSIKEFQKIPRNPITIVVEDVRSLDNVGLIFRVSDGFLVQQLILCGITGYPSGMENDSREPHTIERHDRRIKRTAIQTVPLVPWTYRRDAVAVVRDQKKKGDQIVVVEQTDTSISYKEAAYHTPLTVVVGHERQGVSDAIVEIADIAVEIPMYGYGNSHNVAVATAIILTAIVA